MPGENRERMRKDMKKLLGQLDERWVKAASKELCSQLEALHEQKLPDSVGNILAWTTFFPGEVDLTPYIRSQIGVREVYLPRSLPDYSMTFISVGSNWEQDSTPGAYGIPEPRDEGGTIFSPESEGRDTLILIPGLAFDFQGNRIGRGKGYYDRFLSTPGLSQAVRVGVAWELQLHPSIPVLEHDQAVDYLVHEEGWFATGARSHQFEPAEQV